MNLTKDFDKLNLNEGDVLEFSSKVMEYAKGFKHAKYKNPDTDYKLASPLGVRVIKKSKVTKSDDDSETNDK
jgi:hypothetical protein